MLEEEQLIGDASGLPLLDEPSLEIERVSIPDRAEPPNL
jgi:hypothetical protein